MTTVAKDLMDGTALRTISELTDPVGVLSIYITADPRDGGAAHPGWQVRVANELVALERRLRQDRDCVRADALVLRLADVHREVRALIDRATSGQGRALFVALSGGTVSTVAVQAPMGDHVEIGRSAYVRPLLAAWNAHPPAGVAAVSGHGLRLVDVRLGHATDVGTDSYEPADTGRRDLTRPAAANPALAQHSSAQHDVHARREAERLARFLRGAAGRVTKAAAEFGWEYLVVTGDPQRASALAAGLSHEPAIPTVIAAHLVADLSPGKVHAAVAAELESVRHRCVRERVRRARDLGLGGGAGAVGLADTLTALNEGRVLHLLLDASGEWVGRVDPDGRLYPDLVAAPGLAESDLAAEPRFGERMVEAALHQGAGVTLLEPMDAADLVDAAGVAAILRW